MATNTITLNEAAAVVGIRPAKLEALLNLPDQNPRKPYLLYWHCEEDRTLYKPDVDRYVKHSQERQGSAEILEDEDLAMALMMTGQRRYPDRDRALLVISNYAGLRCVEISKLKMSDVCDFEANELKFKSVLKRSQTKTKTARVAYLGHATLRRHLLSHVMKRIDHGALPGDPLFIGERTGRAYTRHRLAALFKQIYTFAGFAECSSHSGRARLATSLLRQGKNIKVAQQVLGHENETTTLRYIRYTDSELEQAIMGIG